MLHACAELITEFLCSAATVKKKLRRIYFLTPEEAVKLFEEHVNAVTNETWYAVCFME